MTTRTMNLPALSTGRTAQGGSLWARLTAPLVARAAAPRSRVDEAREVREYAARFRASDPGFAADLVAAADRHEALGEAAGGR